MRYRSECWRINVNDIKKNGVHRSKNASNYMWQNTEGWNKM